MAFSNTCTNFQILLPWLSLNCASKLWMWKSEVAPSRLTLWDPMDCSLPGSSVNGIFQARVLEWAAIAFSRGSSQPRDQTQVSCNIDRCFRKVLVSLRAKISFTDLEIYWECTIRKALHCEGKQRVMANCPYYKELREGQARPVHCWLLEDTGHLGFRISNAESHWVEGSRMYE